MKNSKARDAQEARQTEILRLIKQDPDAYFSSVRRSDFGFQPSKKKSDKAK
ncbi:hypothetical protein ABIC28_002049 [Rhodococcus sp. PvR044]|uniref:hypothetical protein n=1 Tax=Rhodococcus sp. PvR044 TaxID=3156402 RepID=UPI003397975E